MRAREAARKRRRNWIAGIGAAVVVIIAAVAITLAVTSNSGSPASATGGTPKLKLASLSTLGTLKPLPSPGPNGPEGVPVPAAAALASTATKATGKTVDGISCDTTEQLVYHVHAHLTVFVNGAARQIRRPSVFPAPRPRTRRPARSSPAGAASTGCTRTPPTGSSTSSPRCTAPTRWGTSSTSGPAAGPEPGGPGSRPVTALYNGQVYQGNPRNIPLEKHAQIQLEVGKPLISPASITFPNGL